MPISEEERKIPAREEDQPPAVFTEELGDDFYEAGFLASHEILDLIGREVDYSGKTYKFEQMDYHNRAHAIAVTTEFVSTSEMLMRVDPSLASERDVLVASIIGCGHDLIQAYTVQEASSFVDSERIRARGVEASESEGATAIFLYDEILSRPEYEVLDVTFDEVYGLLAVTYPRIVFDAGGLRIDQPFLNEDSTVSEYLFAMADLSASCGTYEFERYMEGNWGEFREVNVGLSDRIREGDSIEDISVEDRAAIAHKVLGWVSVTDTFIAWREFYFNAHLDGAGLEDDNAGIKVLPNKAINNSPRADEIKAALRQRYNKFGDNIVAAQELYNDMISTYAGVDRDQYDDLDREGRLALLAEKIEDDGVFKQLLRDVGYEVE